MLGTQVLFSRHCGHKDRSWWRCLPGSFQFYSSISSVNCSLLTQFLFRIKDLEKKLRSVQLAKKKAEETFRRKWVSAWVVPLAKSLGHVYWRQDGLGCRFG